jgi:hypothetical protein
MLSVTLDLDAAGAEQWSVWDTTVVVAGADSCSRAKCRLCCATAFEVAGRSPARGGLYVVSGLGRGAV